MTFIRSSRRPGRRSGDAGGVVLCASETLQPTTDRRGKCPAQPGQLPTPTIGNRRTGDPSRPCAQLTTVLGASPRPFANVFRGTYGAATSVEASPAACARPLEPRFPAGTSARRPPSLDPPLPSSSQPERRAPAGRHSSSRWARLPGHGPSARLAVLVQRRFDAFDPLARSPSGDLGARGKPLPERHEHAPLQIGERTELGGEVEHFHRQVRARRAPLVTGGDLAGLHYRTFRAQVMLRPVRQQVRPCPRRYACSASFDLLSHVPNKERLAVADQLSATRIPIAMPQVNLPPAPDGRPRGSPPVACTTVATWFAERTRPNPPVDPFPENLTQQRRVSHLDYLSVEGMPAIRQAGRAESPDHVPPRWLPGMRGTRSRSCEAPRSSARPQLMVASRYRPGDDRFARRREGAIVWRRRRHLRPLPPGPAGRGGRLGVADERSRRP